MNKWLYVLGVVLIAGFAALNMAQMARTRMATVASVPEVRARRNQRTEFTGTIVAGATSYYDETGELTFRMTDGKGVSLSVRYKGVKPADFDTATEAVVQGSYNGSEFIADAIQLKPPSWHGSSSGP
jgi:cytochrome c-type biogenesis protein CcmE